MADTVNRGFVVWFTGLPSSGKSTLAGLLAQELPLRGLPVEILDGDEVRQRLTKGLGFSKEDRDENIRRIAFVAKLLSRNNVCAITAAISPYRSVRDEARRDMGRFVEVYVKCPLETCIARDVKGLYRRALAGEIQNFTGISDPYEEPLNPEVVVETDQESTEASLGRIVRRLDELGYLTLGQPQETTHVPIPTYLVQKIKTRLDGDSRKNPSTYVVEVLSGLLGEEQPVTMTGERKALIEARLKALGYLE
ncbi:adenylylsulfate kinase [Candidatus Methylomirabilis lanthanidiphila]|uniref:Adenylyl-sulfate kinase n=1 Tax=Candidatus Methylomirabilis lanthanidiphila TaxID=2211376 RepID=A0A564ZL14_9BACT|nr:adenylyl-sulfate kinase [Candidatus Methylomirabilis lanthanidiphila]VUZ86004.1 adenylylsulfate kinase [Candidatus Methylomirabilis lanthanidiphila]